MRYLTRAWNQLCDEYEVRNAPEFPELSCNDALLAEAEELLAAMTPGIRDQFISGLQEDEWSEPGHPFYPANQVLEAMFAEIDNGNV